MQSEMRSDGSLDMPLNWDILVEIMLYCYTEDASRLSRTCHTLLQSAPRALLSGFGDDFQAVALDLPSHLPSFHQFMLSGRHDCSHILRRLRLTSCAAAHDGRALVDILERTKELEFLYLDDAEPLEAGEGEGTLLNVLLHLKRLRTLHIENIFGTTFAQLETMEAPLTHIYATFHPWDFDDSFNPIHALAPFKNSLRVLDVFYAMFPHDDVDILYPQLISLSAESCTTLDLKRLVRCFPGLQDLRIKMARWEGGLGQDYIERHRLWNVASQKRHTWSSLRRLRGSIIQLYILGICCKSNYIDASEVPLDVTFNGRRLAAVLADAHPACLSLHLRSPGFDLLSLAECLAPASDELKAVKLYIELVGHEHDDPLTHISTMLATFTVLRIHSLDMHVEWKPSRNRRAQATGSPDGRDPSWEGTPEDKPSPSLRKSDLRTIAGDAVKYIPTLRFIAIQTSHSSKAELFEIGDPTDADKTLVELSAESRGFEEFYDSIMYKA